MILGMRCLLVLLLLACGPAAARLGDVHPSAITAEQLPPEAWQWQFESLDGERHRLADFRGQVLFVNVWASWCPPCVAELGAIERLIATLPDASIRVLLVSPERPEVVRRFLAHRKFRIASMVEITEMPSAFRLTAVPTTFMIDRGGRLVLRQQGAARWDAEPVRALLAHLANATLDAYTSPIQEGTRPQ